MMQRRSDAPREFLRHLVDALDGVFEGPKTRLGVLERASTSSISEYPSQVVIEGRIVVSVSKRPLERNRGGDLAGTGHLREDRQGLSVIGYVPVGWWLA